jgi:hypothetical protein
MSGRSKKSHLGFIKVFMKFSKFAYSQTLLEGLKIESNHL